MGSMYEQIYAEIIEWQARNPYHEPEICMTVDLLSRLKADTEAYTRITAEAGCTARLFGCIVHPVTEDGSRFWIADAHQIVEDQTPICGKDSCTGCLIRYQHNEDLCRRFAK